MPLVRVASRPKYPTGSAKTRPASLHPHCTLPPHTCQFFAHTLLKLAPLSEVAHSHANMDEDPLPLPSHATTMPNSSPVLSPRLFGKSSSPVPLFSENDSLGAEDATVYESRREKRKRVGGWWAPGPRAAPKKRHLERNFDSGVHMMSDDSEASAASSFARSSFGSDGFSDIPSDPPVPEANLQPPLSQPRLEYDLRKSIMEAMDADATRYEFVKKGIEDSDLDHLQMLNQVVALPPHTGIEVPDEGQYRSMEPELILTLNQNHLRHLSPTLFNIEFLTNLFLRENAIETIPPQIANLKHLQVLDVCFNSIRVLPCELLLMLAPSGSLTRLDLAGNSLCEVGDLSITKAIMVAKYTERGNTYAEKCSTLANGSALSPGGRPRRFSPDVLARLLRFASRNWGDFNGHHRFTPLILNDVKNLYLPENYVLLVSRTTPAYYTETGRLVKNCPPLPMQERVSNPPEDGPRTQPGLMTHTPLGAEGVPEAWFDRPSGSNVPSLFTQTLIRAYDICESNGELGQVRKYMPSYRNPPNVEASLAIAERSMVEVYRPLRACHCCGKEYVVPRAEWIEGWFFNQQVVPVKVAVCSWACVPDIIAKRPEPLKWLDV
ncbi:hypothetical protein BU23DRAFT_553646 [Bimuria novae-zelandiae CBS 107.79]|uniref:Leucine rich repeat domain protein n=1 Tax=Bimuria novae-zelandiae CBS 107.79 TaxID=1447943 RepID=A0A6A5VA04_9PLEO|nr:hypothetical protein BU23DRAFT_553646 [Bimuria novae-zelandiae CBS 107.79]